jgi:hypothetical protein
VLVLVVLVVLVVFVVVLVVVLVFLFLVEFIELINPFMAVLTIVPLLSEEYCQNITPALHLLCLYAATKA